MEINTAVGIAAGAKSTLAEMSNYYKHDNITLPNRYDLMKLISDTSDADKFVRGTDLGSATSSISTVKTIDTTLFPTGSVYDRQLTPHVFSENGLTPNMGDSMVKIEAQNDGSKTAMWVLQLDTPIDLSVEGEIGVTFYADLLSSDSDQNMAFEVVLFPDYTNEKYNSYRYSVDDNTDFNKRNSNSWLHKVQTGIRIPIESGYWFKAGTPKPLNSINAIGLYLTNGTAEKISRVYVSGIYVIKNILKKGAVLLTFDGGYKTTYDIAFPYMKSKGFKGNVGIVAPNIEAGTFSDGTATHAAMTKAQMQEMEASGWDMVSHTWYHDEWNPTTQTYAELYENLRVNAEWLRSNGILRGSRFVAYPGGNYNSWLSNAVKKFHCIGRTTDSLPLLTVPFVNQFNFPSIEINAAISESNMRSKLTIVRDHKFLKVFHMHNIGNEGYGYVTEANFKLFIDIMAEFDLDVITYSELWDRYIVPLKIE